MRGELNIPGDTAFAQLTLPELEASYPVLILKMSRTAVHHGALAVARTLGRRGVRVYAVVEDGFTPLAVSRYLTRAFVWDHTPPDAASFVKAMSLIGESIRRPAIVIPMDDLSAVSLAENAPALTQWFVMPTVPREVPRLLANKICLNTLCAQIGVPTAKILVPTCFDDVKAFANTVQLPVVVKTAEQWRPVRSRFCTKIVETRDELFDLFEHFDYQGEQQIIIQERIPGDDWIVHGYYNSGKNLSLTFTGRKLCSYPHEAGSTALGLSISNETLRRESEKFLAWVRFSGIIDMDWRLDERDGKYRLLDCNPRIGQNFRMFENDAGLDVVLAQHLDLSGMPVDTASSTQERLFTVESFYAMAVARQRIRPSSEPSGITRPDCAVSELAWWAGDDPVPFVMMSARVILRILGRAFEDWFYTPLRSRLSNSISHSWVSLRSKISRPV